MRSIDRSSIPIVLLFTFAACSEEPQLEPMPGMALEGYVSYEARLPTIDGLSAEREERPARFVFVEVVDNNGEVLASGTSDEEGRFAFTVPDGGVKAIVSAQTGDVDGDIMVTTDSSGESPHKIEAVLSTAELPLEIKAVDTAIGGPGGAFHILDTMLIGLETAEVWTSTELPPFFIYWGRGITTDWSYYLGEVPPNSGRYGFEILGGQPGAQSTSDTDEHDEVIILHELGHFVMDFVSTSSSLAGPHPPGVLTDPGLAWEEGRVSWFAVALVKNPLYQDTVGIEPEGSLRVNRDYSLINLGPQGIGSEQTVTEVLWDLADGAGELVDADEDGVALGADGVIAAMMALAEEEGAYPCLPSFLLFLIEAGWVEESALRQMLDRAGHPVDVLPLDGVSPWPLDMVIGEEIAGEIDGVTDPAPSGGPAHPATGIDAVQAYRFHLDESAPVEVELSIEGTGSLNDTSDLDVELRDIRANLLASSRTLDAIEVIEPRLLSAGWYVVYVRDGGDGNLASYRLRVSLAEN